MPPTRAQISVALDSTTGAALEVLTADGTSIADAVRTALINAALIDSPGNDSDHHWLSRLLEDNVPLPGAVETLLAELVAPQSSPPMRCRSSQLSESVNRSASRIIYERLERMDAEAGTSTGRKGGRPAKYLLSRIAVCGVCNAPLRVGTQNVGKPRGHDEASEPSRYRVYECPGVAGQPGFHVSMRQEHLDQLITEVVLERVSQPGFKVPSRLKDEATRDEHDALRAEIAGHWAWLEEVRAESARRGSSSDLLRPQQNIVLPKIQAAQHRMVELEKRDPLVTELYRAFPAARQVWKRMAVAQQRHVVRMLVVPRIHPIDPSDRGLRGINERRVELLWR